MFAGPYSDQFVSEARPDQATPVEVEDDDPERLEAIGEPPGFVAADQGDDMASNADDAWCGQA